VAPRWLPVDFPHPTRVELATGHHLRPIRADDVALDYPAVMGSRERLWARYGAAWGWPPATMTFEQDRADLARHDREIAANETFNYAVLDAAESALLGCVYLDPPAPGGASAPAPEHDVEVSWWVVDEMVGTGLERELEEFLPRWVVTAWPFRAPLWTP
jgi:hypothetical protein